ncbi:hypothetical protein [Actinoplanes sp. NPDC026623]
MIPQIHDLLRLAQQDEADPAALCAMGKGSSWSRYGRGERDQASRSEIE